MILLEITEEGCEADVEKSHLELRNHPWAANFQLVRAPQRRVFHSFVVPFPLLARI